MEEKLATEKEIIMGFVHAYANGDVDKEVLDRRLDMFAVMAHSIIKEYK